MGGKVCDIKSRRRQRTQYTDSLNNYVTRKLSTNNEVIRRVGDNEDWKAMIADMQQTWHMVMMMMTRRKMMMMMMMMMMMTMMRRRRRRMMMMILSEHI